MSAEQELRDWIEAEKGSKAPVDATGRGWTRLKKAVDSGDAPLAVPLSIDPSRGALGYGLLAVMVGVVGALGTTAYLASSGSLGSSNGAISAPQNSHSPDDVQRATSSITNELVPSGHDESGQSRPTKSATLQPAFTVESQSPAPRTAGAPTSATQPQPRARRRAAVQAPAETGTATSVDDELRLITNAKSALDRGELRAATASLSEHRVRFPSGFLSAERDALKLLVLCSHQKPQDAAGRVEAFARRYPESPLLDRIRRACLDPSSSSGTSEPSELE